MIPEKIKALSTFGYLKTVHAGCARTVCQTLAIQLQVQPYIVWLSDVLDN